MEEKDFSVGDLFSEAAKHGRIQKNEQGEIVLKGISDEVVIGRSKGKQKKESLEGLSEDRNEVMRKFIFDESKIFKEKNFTQLKFNQDTFAYGMTLPKEKEVTDRMGNVVGKSQVWDHVLITSDKSNPIIEATKENENKYKIKFNSKPSQLSLRWSLLSIKNYLENDETFPKLTGQELFDKIKNQYEKYLFFRDPRWYLVHILWDLGTYAFELFDAYPILENRGISGTGKTKTMRISNMITLNSSGIMVNPSEATLFRETEDKRPTQYFDEAEKLFVFKKGQLEADNRVELINSGYSKGAKVPRQEKFGNRYVTVYYNTYSPKQISSINGLYGATETRAITHIHTRTSDEDSRGESEPNENDPVWQILRDYCYDFFLRNWRIVETNYQDNSLYKDLKLKKRDLQLWRPLLAVARTINENLFDEIVSFATELSEMKLEDFIPESSFDYSVLKALKETIEIYDSTDKHYIERIKEAFCKDKPEEEKSNIYLNRNIATHLKKLGFTKKRGNEGAFIQANKSLFDQIVAPICPELSFLSSLSTLSTPLQGKLPEKSDDRVTMGVDNKKEEVTMVKINVDNVDVSEKASSQIVQKTIISLEQKIGKTIPLNEIVSDLSGQLTEEQISQAINELKSQGWLHEPKQGFFQRIE